MAKANKERLYEDLKRRVLTLDLEPDTDLDETRLSAEYGMSRTPVRDVLRQLAGEGYVSIVDNKGASVASMNHKTLRDFFITAPAIYASIARLAVENARPAQIKTLKAVQKQFRAGVETCDTEALIFFNNEFHSVMGDMADNQYLTPSLRRLLIDHARIGQTFFRGHNAERLRSACEHHDAFIEAIERHDAEAAVQLAHDHWALSRDQIELFVRPDPLAMDDVSGAALDRGAA